MTSARIQRLCRKYDINIGCFDGQEINPGNVSQEICHCSYILINSV